MSIERDLSISRSTASIRQVVGAEVLVIDKDEGVQRGMVDLLSKADLHVTCASNPADGLEHLGRSFFSVVVIDLDTPTPGAGLETIALVKERSPTSMVVLLTPRKAFDAAAAAVRAGAIDIVFKSPESVPYLEGRIMEAASRSVDTREVTTILREVKEAHDDFLRRFMDAERRALDAADRLAGRDPSRIDLDEIHMLVVAPTPTLAEALAGGGSEGYAFQAALSGGQALDLCGSNTFHYVLVGSGLPDLPSSMVVRSIKSQSPESVVMTFSGPGPGGRIDIVETQRTTAVVSDFTDPQQLLARLDELAEAFRAKSRERRYTQAFRERHYDFLRRYVELKSKVERTLAGIEPGDPG